MSITTPAAQQRSAFNPIILVVAYRRVMATLDQRLGVQRQLVGLASQPPRDIAATVRR